MNWRQDTARSACRRISMMASPGQPRLTLRIVSDGSEAMESLRRSSARCPASDVRPGIVDTKSPGRLVPSGAKSSVLYADIRTWMSLSVVLSVVAGVVVVPLGDLVVAALGLRQVDLDAAG